MLLLLGQNDRTVTDNNRKWFGNKPNRDITHNVYLTTCLKEWMHLSQIAAPAERSKKNRLCQTNICNKIISTTWCYLNNYMGFKMYQSLFDFRGHRCCWRVERDSSMSALFILTLYRCISVYEIPLWWGPTLTQRPFSRSRGWTMFSIFMNRAESLQTWRPLIVAFKKQFFFKPKD